MKKWTVLTLVVLVALVLAACGPTTAPTQAPAQQPAATTAPAATEPPAAVATEPPAAPAATEPAAATEPPPATTTTGGAGTAGESAGSSEEAARAAGLTYLADAYAGNFRGTSVSMMGPFVDADQVLFDRAVAEFEQATGIDIAYEGTKQFETTIGVRVDAGDPPDIADFPQPGLLKTVMRSGDVVDLSWMNQDWLKQNYAQSWLDMGMIENRSGQEILAGTFGRYNAKSLVWYPKAAFDEAGYTVPTTWDELEALEQEIVADGDAPWCIGIESGVATGWPVTDWMEDIMLRTTSLENYDRWVAGELKFDSPEVRNAAEIMSERFLDPSMADGGPSKIVATSFMDAPKGMFSDPPTCWLHRQGNFITSFFPENLTPGEDWSFFYLPGIDEQYGKPFLVAGDIYAMFDDRPEVRAVMEFFSTGESLRGWIATGGAFSPHADFPAEWYGNPIERQIAELVDQATALRFDASDLMPGEVGGGSFWKSMTSYISGTTDLDTALREIDASWPR